MFSGIRIRKRHLTAAAGIAAACVVSGALISQASPMGHWGSHDASMVASSGTATTPGSSSHAQSAQSRSHRGKHDGKPSRTPAPTDTSPSPTAPASASAAKSSTGTGNAKGTAGSSSAKGTSLNVLLTGYGWWDNTPPGSSDISNPVIHQKAGGKGTYADPITVAVPYHCANGCLQWPAGTRFYLPSLHRYLIVEDTCGDGGADSCPDSTGNHLDVWVGGKSLSHSASDACEESITGKTTAILNPANNLAVTPGDICK